MIKMEYYKINFDNLWFTSDGTETGEPCRVTLSNAAALVVTRAGNTQIAADGTVYNEFPITTGGGVPFSVQVPVLPAARFATLKTKINELTAEDAAAKPFAATGTPGDITVNVKPNFQPVFMNFDSFDDENIYNLTLNFLTAT